MIKSFGKLSSWICSLPVDYYSSHTSSSSSYPRLFSPISFAVDLEQLFIVPRLDVPLFNVHELRDGAVAHPSSPFAAFSLKGLASSSSTSRVLSSPPFSKANLRSCRFLSREHFALCRRFNAPSPTHALFPPFPPRHARAPSFISSVLLSSRLLFLAMQTRVFWSPSSWIGITPGEPSTRRRGRGNKGKCIDDAQVKKMGRDPPRIAVHRQIFRSLTYRDASGYVWDDDVTQRVGWKFCLCFRWYKECDLHRYTLTKASSLF